MSARMSLSDIAQSLCQALLYSRSLPVLLLTEMPIGDSSIRARLNCSLRRSASAA